MSGLKLNKELYTDVTRLKLLNKKDIPIRFNLETSPFTGEEDDDDYVETRQEFTVVGLIYPKSIPYNEFAFRIEMKLNNSYPFVPPAVRFLTPIYHPNVDQKGEFCSDLLKKTAKHLSKATLVDVLGFVVKHIDEPDIDYALSVSLGKEYLENRPEFNRKALEHIRQHALPRD